MAPSPVLNIEPKEPDKNTEKSLDNVSQPDKQKMSNNIIDSSSKDKSYVESNDVNKLSDDELRSLLDEAISYRNPKDRENTSILFQKYLNEAEERDNFIKGFIDGCSHDSVGDPTFLNNIVGGCEREKKKKTDKRDSSNSNGSSRRGKFTHSLNINKGPQSSIYNGIVVSGGSGSTNSYHSSNRNSSRTQQSLSTRLSTSKATLLTSSSNIDIPMVTTSNKQPIMTPAEVPRKQQKTEFVVPDLRNPKASCSSDETSNKKEEIEMKLLNGASGCSYTAHASLNIDGNVLNTKTKPMNGNEKEDALISCSLGSSTTLQNGNVETLSKGLNICPSFNGTSYNREDDSTSILKESDKEKQHLLSKKKNKRKEISSADVVTGNQTASVNEIRTNNILGLSCTGYNTLFSGNSSRNNYPNKESLEQKSQDKYDRMKKKKKQLLQEKPYINSYKAQEVEGHCGGMAIPELVKYVDGDGNANNHSVYGTNHKNARTKPMSNVANKHEKQLRSKACTDENIRNKKLTKTTERLQKSTSLEDLRHNRSKSNNKKQSVADDSHYARADDAKMRSPPPVSILLPSSAEKVEKTVTPEETTSMYFESPIEENDTETGFETVTKKKSKKKRTEQKTTGFLPHNYSDRNQDGGSFKRSTRSTENRHRSRRKSVSSVVPSDKISDSDSIHSLPVSSTTPKCKIKKKSTSSGCTPQASYADIAKSPQCQSSMTLNGDSTAAKWQTKAFSNVSSFSSPNGHSNDTSTIFNSTGSSSNSGDTLNHSDNMELVSSPKYEDHVKSDDGCDQLLLTSSNNLSSNSCSGSDSPATFVNNSNIDKVKNINNNMCSNINDSNNNHADNDINGNIDLTRNGITLKRKNKINKNKNENDITNPLNNNHNDNTNINANVSTNVNSYSHVCSNGKLGKSTTKDGRNTSTDTNNGICISRNSNNIDCNSNHRNDHDVTNVAIATKSKTKGKISAENHESPNRSNLSPKDNSANEDLFIEFTLKCASTVKTKCSQTQTDLVEVNNNTCCNDVSVEETVIVKNVRNSESAMRDGNLAKFKKSPCASSNSLAKVDETDGSRVVLLPSSAGDSETNAVTVGFDLDAKQLEEAAVKTVKRRADLSKEILERSSKYNVTEVIQYVNKSWNEVMESLSSATKITETKKLVQYYDAK